MDTFVGREEDIRNITGYLDFTSSDVEVVHIVGPPGFGKSTLAKTIGHIFLRKGIRVHYADIRAVTNLDTVAEKVMLSIVDSTKYRVTFNHLQDWVHKRYSNTLIILDNCDEIFETHKKEFLDAIRTLTLSSIQKGVRYILTSQKWEADVGNYYQLHAIYNLSTEAASQLLGKLAPSLTDVQKMQIAELTGNVPLALDVVGAIFKFPNAPTAEEVIQSLKEHPVITLSMSKIHLNLNVSIGLAFSYLSPELKQLCLNLSHFPGSFSGESAFAIFDMNSESQRAIWYWSRLILRESQLDMLVQRSLLQFNNALKRFHFHQLIQKYFLHVSAQEEVKSKYLKKHFESKFQLHFANILGNILIGHLAVTVLEDEKHNFQYMFSLFTTAKHINNTYVGIEMTLLAMQLNLLRHKFHPTELLNISWNMLMGLELHTAAEEASVESFLETYVSVVIETAKLERSLHIKADIAIEILSLKQRRIDDGYRKSLVSNNTYVQFYRVLAQYFKENGQEENATLCHAHILAITHDQLDHCYPHCDYFSISIAYENVGDSVHAFQFRELAYEHQWFLLSLMHQAKLTIDLYNDYSNESLGNSISQADQFSSLITENVYENLLRAPESEYLEDVYYDAIDFFRAKNMEQHVLQLQFRMHVILLSRCNWQDIDDLLKYCLHVFPSVLRAWKRQCYHFTVFSGKNCLFVLNKKNLTETYTIMLTLSVLVGKSYYQIGNYSDAQIWLKRALQMINVGLRDQYSLKFREDRLDACFYLLMSGDCFNVFCYGYTIKDFVNLLFAKIIEEVYEINSQQPPKKQPEAEAVILSTETGVTEEKYSFVWSQLNHYAHKFQCVIDKHISIYRAERILRQVDMYASLIVLFFIIILCCFIILLVYMFSMCICIYLLSFFCTRQQSKQCFKFTVFASTISMFIFVLGLDVLY